MADAKWIDDLQSDMPLVEAARLVLGARLTVVRERLPQALHQADENVEHVHQLRVSTRRAGAALKIFASCLPRKAYKRMRSPLRRLRRAAGAARDWDVFLADMEARRRRPRAEQQPGLDFLFGYGQGQRVASQAQLVEATQQPPLDLDQLVERTLDALRPPSGEKPPPRLRDHAVPLLTELVDELNQAAQRDLQDYEHLHQVRIIGKRLRYALEVFVCCFGTPFHKQLYPTVTEMQEILGSANDSHVAGLRLQTIKSRLTTGPTKTWKRLAPGVEAPLVHHERHLPRQRRLFTAWWKRWQALSVASRLPDMMTAG